MRCCHLLSGMYTKRRIQNSGEQKVTMRGATRSYVESTSTPSVSVETVELRTASDRACNYAGADVARVDRRGDE
jgi:hypothetical protein